MALLAAQPTEEGALQQFGVEPERRATCSGHLAAASGTPSVVSSDDDALSSPLAP